MSIEAKKIGRPRLTPEERAASAQKHAEYMKNYYENHKTRYIERNVCPYCDKHFASASSMKYHMTRSRKHAVPEAPPL